jgi:hypothetical protein
MALGSSFSVTPAGLEEQAQRTKKRLPTQQALQTLSMQLPKVLGAEGLAPSSRTRGAYTPGDKFAGAGGGDQSASQMARMMRKMSGYTAGAAKPQGPRFTQGTTGTTTAPKAAAPMAPKAAAPPPPRSTRPPSRDDDEAPGGYEAPERGEPGYVDTIPNPPSQMAGSPPPAQAAPPPAQAAPPPVQSAPPQQAGYYDNQGNYHPMGNYQTARSGSGQASGGY